ncbi:MAG: hypothetical protein JWO82_2904 [Akkermansiaceae bacterium]|nr:hypothetical protein [Akkermansiaceae bacterium]
MVAIHDRPAAPQERSAYLLLGTPSFLLNQLPALGRCTMILREQGLSLAKETTFGLFTTSAASGRWDLLQDRLSHLESSLTAPQHFHLLADPEDCCPLLTAGIPGEPIDLTIRLENHCWDSHEIRTLLRDHAVPVDIGESWARSAGAWLDDWLQPPPPADAAALCREVRRCLTKCSLLEVAVSAGAHHANTRFKPAFHDTEGTVFRIADAGRNNVVYADVADAAFRMEMLSPSHLLIRRGPRRNAGSLASTRAAA